MFFDPSKPALSIQAGEPSDGWIQFTSTKQVNPALSAFAADIAKDVKTRSQALSLSRMAADSAFLFCPISLGMLAQYYSCSVALYTTAGLITAANAVFAFSVTVTASLAFALGQHATPWELGQCWPG